MKLNMKPRDVVIAAKLAAGGGGRTYDFLSESLVIARSQIHESVKRLNQCHMANEMKIDKKAFLFFVISGLRYVFPVVKKGASRGIPTGINVVIESESESEKNPVALVWPKESEVGTIQGEGIEPLHSSCLFAVKDRPFWELLALIDQIRIGGSDLRRAGKELRERL